MVNKVPGGHDPADLDGSAQRLQQSSEVPSGSSGPELEEMMVLLSLAVGVLARAVMVGGMMGSYSFSLVYNSNVWSHLSHDNGDNTSSTWAISDPVANAGLPGRAGWPDRGRGPRSSGCARRRRPTPPMTRRRSS